MGLTGWNHSTNRAEQLISHIFNAQQEFFMTKFYLERKCKWQLCQSLFVQGYESTCPGLCFTLLQSNTPIRAVVLALFCSLMWDSKHIKAIHVHGMQGMQLPLEGLLEAKKGTLVWFAGLCNPLMGQIGNNLNSLSCQKCLVTLGAFVIRRPG